MSDGPASIERLKQRWLPPMSCDFFRECANTVEWYSGPGVISELLLLEHMRRFTFAKHNTLVDDRFVIDKILEAREQVRRGPRRQDQLQLDLDNWERVRCGWEIALAHNQRRAEAAASRPRLRQLRIDDLEHYKLLRPAQLPVTQQYVDSHGPDNHNVAASAENEAVEGGAAPADISSASSSSSSSSFPSSAPQPSDPAAEAVICQESVTQQQVALARLVEALCQSLREEAAATAQYRAEKLEATREYHKRKLALLEKQQQSADAV